MRSSIRSRLVTLLFLGAVYVVLFPLGGIHAIFKHSVIRDDQCFLVENAVAAEPAQHDWLRHAMREREPFEPRSERVHRIHRIARGKGTVIGWRFAYDDPGMIDEEHMRKFTVFIPGTIPPGETVITLGAAGHDRAYVVESSESVAWGSACLGIARTGTIRLVRDGGDHVEAAFDFVVEQIADENTYRVHMTCPAKRYEAKAVLNVVSYEDLTPWQGRARGKVEWGERWPGGEE